jgi:DNA repair protein RecN (Recombination protein N)
MGQMLSFLQIRNFAIVESLDLEFSDGFTAITGETGAGKSILVDALGLLRGNRADIAAIRAGASKAELNAEFELEEGNPALVWLQNAELDIDSSCLLRRLISENGRSRAWINGTSVTLQQLADLGDLLIEIHGQNEHIRLVRSEEQFRLLDGYGTHNRELKAVDSRYRAWNLLEQEKQTLLAESPLDAGDTELLRYQVRELEGALLSPGEFQLLETDHRRLAQGSEIIAALQQAQASLTMEQTGVVDALNAAIAGLQDYRSLDTDIMEAAQLLNEAAINCEEARGSLQSAMSRMDLSPERLKEVEEKLRVQYDLARKHRVEPEQLTEVLENLEQRLHRAGSIDQRLEDIEPALEKALQDYGKAARNLNRSRRTRSAFLSDAVSDLMQQLGMEGGRFEIRVHFDVDAAPSPRGSDHLDLRVSANPGIPLAPLRKVASGGELSRISLAIKVASKAGVPAQTQVFDEVDAGIGGDTANAVGALLRSLSVSGQALCVTHLAQVAVCADHQFQVQKTSEDQATRVETVLLAEKERVDEIARMLGGRLSEQSRAHASELLATVTTRH